jgi:two-component system LytT family response regulator
VRRRTEVIVSTRLGWLAAGDLGRLVETNVDADATVDPVDPANDEHETARVAMAPARDGAAPYLTRIAVRSLNRLVIVPVSSIIRLEAEDNYVRIWADRPYLHKDTLTGLVAKLDPARFLRVHRSHAVAIDAVRELHPQLHGEYLIVLCDGTEITSGRSYKTKVQDAFGLGRGAEER